ncbi:MAG TPA: energy transducer TonB [Gammaproteobacteria bacterium]|nr:energy transducer TonB [Gammaproteobacteria bacterium]
MSRPSPLFRTVLRFAGSALIAMLIVFFVTAVILHFFRDEEDPAALWAQDVLEGVEVITSRSDPRLVEALRASGVELEKPRREPPPPALPPRMISGFVQLEFTVNADGTVGDVRVVGAVPGGYYERQAVEQVKARRYTPQFTAEGPVARRETAVIEFTVPAQDGDPAAAKR